MLLVRGARPLAGAATRLSPRGLSTTNKFVLTLNAGSSSIKFGVFDVAGGTPVERCSGIVEEVGSDHSRLKLVVDGEVKRDVADLHIKGHGEALANIRDALAPQLPGEIAAVGHRVVHGGAAILGAARCLSKLPRGTPSTRPNAGPALVDDAIVDEVDACAALAPLHNPANALGIRFARDTWGGVPHVVVTTCVEINILRRVRAESARRPPRHRRDACSMAWRCRFLSTRRSQDGRVIAEK